MTAARCTLCRSALDANGQCPGAAPFLRILGGEYGTAAQFVHRLQPGVTVGMVYRWRDRDGLPTHHLGRTVYSPLDHAAIVERDKRVGGRGRKRRVDTVALVA